jgi:hypothetical protein
MGSASATVIVVDLVASLFPFSVGDKAAKVEKKAIEVPAKVAVIKRRCASAEISVRKAMRRVRIWKLNMGVSEQK